MAMLESCFPLRRVLTATKTARRYRNSARRTDLACTLEERNDVERRLVDLQYEEEKARNDYVIGA